MHKIDSFDIKHNNRTFRVELRFDDSSIPWERSTLGSVSDWTTDSKTPGQRILCSDGILRRYYDFQSAVRKAKQESEDTSKALAAVEYEFERFRDWCDNRWCYVGVYVFPLTNRGDELRSYPASLWGVESDDLEYIKQVSVELAEECNRELMETGN